MPAWEPSELNAEGTPIGFLLNCDTSLRIAGLADLGGILSSIPVSVQVLLTNTCWAEGRGEEGGAEEELQAWLKKSLLQLWLHSSQIETCF